MHEITDLLKKWSNGDEHAFEQLIPLVDKELKKLAHHYMRNERPGNILQTTALVNEALMKLIREHISWENRSQFYGFVARRMRQVLVDYARRTQQADYVDVEDAVIPDETPKEILMLDQALTKLAGIDERKANIVECRFFIGLTHAEISDLLGMSQSTVDRDWHFARAWLKHEMTDEPLATD